MFLLKIPPKLVNRFCFKNFNMYAVFGLFTLVLVALDIYQTRGGVVSMKKANLSIFWFFGLCVCGSIYLFWGFLCAPQPLYQYKAAVSFLTGYLLEKSLSVDNLFVFAIIFAQYNVPEYLRPRALLWGVIGALLLRAVMIAVVAAIGSISLGIVLIRGISDLDRY